MQYLFDMEGVRVAANYRMQIGHACNAFVLKIVSIYTMSYTCYLLKITINVHNVLSKYGNSLHAIFLR